MTPPRPDLAGLRARALAATPGPWNRVPGSSLVVRSGTTQYDGPPLAECEMTIDVNDGLSLVQASNLSRANADHIAGLSPDVVLALCAYVECVESECQRLREDADSLRRTLDTYRGDDDD